MKRAISALTMKIPEPIIDPTTTIVESYKPSPRVNSESITGVCGCMDLIQYHECVSMHPFRRELAPMVLAGAAAVCTVVSIAAFEILMGAALVALIATRTPLRVPRIWIPFAVFAAGTIVSMTASGHFRQGLPQVKKFYVYLM